MYLFTRTMRLAGGHMPDAGAWAVSMAERVTASTDLQVGLYTRAMSPGLGTMAFSAWVADLSALENANATLGADADYLAATNKGAGYTDHSGVDDALIQIVHGDPDPAREVNYVWTVQTACANGKLGRGVEVGVALAQHAEKVTGVTTMFGLNVTGDYGGVGWITGYETIDQYQADQQKLMGDPDWVAMIDRDAGPAYTDVPSASAQVLWRRLV